MKMIDYFYGNQSIIYSLYMKSIKIVCMGDSLTEGYGIPQSARWTDLLRHEMTADIINRGISGDTTGGMLARFQSEVIAAAPTHAIIMGGTNDLWFGLSHQLVLSNYHAMLRHARLHGIQAIIGIALPVFHEGFSDDADHQLYQNLPDLSCRISELQDKLRIYAIDQNLPSIDFSKGMVPDLFLPDGVHPNEAGNLVMMKNAKKTLTKLDFI